MVIHAPHENVCHHITSYKIKNFVLKRTFFFLQEWEIFREWFGACWCKGCWCCL